MMRAIGGGGAAGKTGAAMAGAAAGRAGGLDARAGSALPLVFGQVLLATSGVAERAEGGRRTGEGRGEARGGRRDGATTKEQAGVMLSVVQPITAMPLPVVASAGDLGEGQAAEGGVAQPAMLSAGEQAGVEPSFPMLNGLDGTALASGSEAAEAPGDADGDGAANPAAGIAGKAGSADVVADAARFVAALAAQGSRAGAVAAVANTGIAPASGQALGREVDATVPQVNGAEARRPVQGSASREGTRQNGAVLVAQQGVQVSKLATPEMLGSGVVAALQASFDTGRSLMAAVPGGLAAEQEVVAVNVAGATSPVAVPQSHGVVAMVANDGPVGGLKDAAVQRGMAGVDGAKGGQQATTVRTTDAKDGETGGSGTRSGAGTPAEGNDAAPALASQFAAALGSAAGAAAATVVMPGGMVQGATALLGGVSGAAGKAGRDAVAESGAAKVFVGADAPAGASGAAGRVSGMSDVTVSRLLQTAAGSELRVGTRIEGLGAVSIRTVLGRAEMQTHIAVESDKLGSALLNHMAGLEESLGGKTGQAVRATVSVGTEMHGSGGQREQQDGRAAAGQEASTGSRNGQSGQGARYEERGTRGVGVVSETRGTGGDVARYGAEATGVSGSRRLDVRV